MPTKIRSGATCHFQIFVFCFSPDLGQPSQRSWNSESTNYRNYCRGNNWHKRWNSKKFRLHFTELYTRKYERDPHRKLFSNGWWRTFYAEFLRGMFLSKDWSVSRMHTTQADQLLWFIRGYSNIQTNGFWKNFWNYVQFSGVVVKQCRFSWRLSQGMT